MASTTKESNIFNFESKDFLSKCSSAYQEMRKSGKLCDIQIILKNQTIKAHQVILVGAIPYFYEIIGFNNQESRREMLMKYCN